MGTCQSIKLPPNTQTGEYPISHMSNYGFMDTINKKMKDMRSDSPPRASDLYPKMEMPQYRACPPRPLPLDSKNSARQNARRPQFKFLKCSKELHCIPAGDFQNTPGSSERVHYPATTSVPFGIPSPRSTNPGFAPARHPTHCAQRDRWDECR